MGDVRSTRLGTRKSTSEGGLPHMIWSFFLPAAKRSRRPKSWPPRWNFSQHRGCDQRRRVFRTTPWRGQQGLTSSTKATTYPGKTRLQPRSRSPASSRCSTASCLGGLRVSLPRLWLPSGSWLNSFAGAALLPLPVFTKRATALPAVPFRVRETRPSRCERRLAGTARSRFREIAAQIEFYAAFFGPVASFPDGTASERTGATQNWTPDALAERQEELPGRLAEERRP